MKRRQISGRLLDRACVKVNKLVASELKHNSCRTLELDGWDSTSSQQLVNFMLSTFDSEEFLGDRDLIGLGKSAADMTKLVIEVIELVELSYQPYRRYGPCSAWVSHRQPHSDATDSSSSERKAHAKGAPIADLLLLVASNQQDSEGHFQNPVLCLPAC